MPAALQPKGGKAVLNLSNKRLDGGGGTCAQRIEAQTVRDRRQVTLSESQVLDAEHLFRAQDTDGTGLLSRGALTEALRTVGLESKLGEQTFRSTVRLAFDAHSADSHFLSLVEFKQLYYLMCTWYPEILPRGAFLRVHVLRAKGLPALDVNGKSDPFTVVQIPGKPRSKTQTRHIERTLDPVWNAETDDKYCYEEGDDLLFEVFDYDRASRSELIGRARLAGREFHQPGGFCGDLQLVDLPRDFRGPPPTLAVRVTVTEIEAKVPSKTDEAVGKLSDSLRGALAGAGGPGTSNPPDSAFAAVVGEVLSVPVISAAAPAAAPPAGGTPE
jgi:hypothetical protein